MSTPGMGVDMRILFVAVVYINSIFSVYQTQNNPHPFGWGLFWLCGGIRKDDPTVGRVKKCPVDTFLVRGRIPVHPVASRRDIDGCTVSEYNIKKRKVVPHEPKMFLAAIAHNFTSLCYFIAGSDRNLINKYASF